MSRTASETSALWPTRPWRPLTICLGLLFVARAAAIYFAHSDLYFDEAQYWTWAQDPAFGYFSKPPLLAWIIAAVTGVCGDGEVCIRLSSPLLHTVTPVFIFLAGRALYGPAVGFWSALAFATMPGISLSNGIISTDVPLLLIWSAALFFWIKLERAPGWGWAVALGVAFGLGLLAKYAMAYFVLCAVLYCAFEREARPLLRDPRLLLVLALGALFIAPNVWWNVDNGFATFEHTAENADWRGTLFHPLKALEFFGAQFGVFGPILFAALLIAAWRLFTGRLDARGRMLACFSLPVIALITVQGLLSRAHANWAAVAYPAATILVTAMLLEPGVRKWFRASMGLHLVVAACFVLAFGAAGRVLMPSIIPVYELLGWRAVADATRERLKQDDYVAILTNYRLLTAELLYYLRDSDIPIYAWAPPGKPPHDHYQLTRPYTGAETAGPILLVSTVRNPDSITESFSDVEPLDVFLVKTGTDRQRGVRFFRVSGPKPPLKSPAAP